MDFLFDPTHPIGLFLWVIFGSYSIYQYITYFKKKKKK